MDIVKILKEEQREYNLSLLEDIQDSSGAAVQFSPGGKSPAAETLFPTSFPRNKTKIILKRIPTTSMEDFLMRLQLIQNMAAKEQQEQQPEEDTEQMQANENLLYDVRNFLSEKKNFNIFGPKSLKTLATLSLASGIGIPTQVAHGEPKKQEQQQVYTSSDSDKIDVVRDMLVPQLKQSEGWRPRLYKDHKGNPTVGHGALVDGSFKSTMKKVFPHQSDEWVKKVSSGNMELTAAQGHELLTYQAREKHNETRNMIGHDMFDNMHPELQTALTDAHFRGSLRGSPKTMALIKAGDLQGASKEFLNNDEYRQSVKQKTGVYKRMENVSKVLAKYHGTVKIAEPKKAKTKK